MNPPIFFSSLPPELVSKICNDSVLEREDLIALRLTNKSQGIHLFASEEFADRYFTDVPLVYTHYSLQTFMEICKHAIFGRAVRTVELSYTRFLPDYYEEESKGLFKNLWLLREERHDHLDNIRRLVNRCDEEQDLAGSDDAVDLLTAAFTALSQWHHPLELSVSSSESDALGQNLIHSFCKRREIAHWECDILGTVALLCRTASLGNCVVQRLNIRGTVWNNLVDRSSHSLSALAWLPELVLSLGSERQEDIAQVAGLEGMVSKLLQNAVLLKSLHLISDPDSSHKYFHKIFSTISTMKLEKLTLTGIDLDQFKPFKKRINSLRHLELRDCEVEESLKDILLAIKKNVPRLEYFRLSGTSRQWLNGKVKLKGVQGVKNGIDKLLQSRQDYLDNPG
jgi:hypothetical protein